MEVIIEYSVTGQLVTFVCPDDSPCHGSGLIVACKAEDFHKAAEAWNRRAAHHARTVQEPKPYAYEFGRSNGDGTYSVVIEKGSPVDPVHDWPITPLYIAEDVSAHSPVETE